MIKSIWKSVFLIVFNKCNVFKWESLNIVEKINTNNIKYGVLYIIFIVYFDPIVFLFSPRGILVFFSPGDIWYFLAQGVF